jgi:hypothetical protein
MQVDFASLEGHLTYKFTVDTVARLQRGIKEKVAWLEWADRLIKHLSTEEDIAKLFILPTDDHLMGCWINGMDKLRIHWLLEERVPCFIIHTLSPEDLRGFTHADTRFRAGFVEGSKVEELRADRNSSEFITMKHLRIRDKSEVSSQVDH